MELANRLKSLTPSTTLAITAKANEMKAHGINVIGLGAGEPDFNTPDHIIDAAEKAMNAGFTKYTPSGGLAELKAAIRDKMSEDQHIEYDLSEIIVTNGAKHALYLLFQALLNEGDEVIIPVPYWVSYPEQVKLAGGVPVFIETSEKRSFKITPEELEKKITPKTKAVIINSPNNPSGMIYTREELTAIGEICVKNNLLIVSDEIYEKLIYGSNSHISIAQISEKLRENTIIINGVSKSHAMTGWRIGYACGGQTMIKQMTNLASHSTSNPATPSQYGAIAAYRGNDAVVDHMRKTFERRLNSTYEKLINIPGFTCLKPNGAFYLFPNVKKAADRLGYSSVDDFAKALLEKAHVAVIPGSGFGVPDHIRISYATSESLLDEAIQRIHSFVIKNWD